MISSLISAYFWLCALLFKIEFNYFQKITREHRELFEIKSLFKVKNTSMNSLRSAKSSIRICDAIYGCLPTVGYCWLWFYLNAFIGLTYISEEFDQQHSRRYQKKP